MHAVGRALLHAKRGAQQRQHDDDAHETCHHDQDRRRHAQDRDQRDDLHHAVGEKPAAASDRSTANWHRRLLPRLPPHQRPGLCWAIRRQPARAVSASANFFRKRDCSFGGRFRERQRRSRSQSRPADRRTARCSRRRGAQAGVCGAARSSCVSHDRKPARRAGLHNARQAVAPRGERRRSPKSAEHKHQCAHDSGRRRSYSMGDPVEQRISLATLIAG